MTAMASVRDKEDNSARKGERLCPATLSDYDAVMAIDRNVYSGLDYLADQYRSVVQNPAVTAFLYKNDERVVGFGAAELVDGGQTLVTSSGRIAEDCRGGGMFSRFKQQMFKHFRGYRGLENVAFTTNNNNMKTNGHKILKTYRIVEEKEITSVMVDLTEAKLKFDKRVKEFPGLRRLSRDDIDAMMSRKASDLLHLFPQGRVTVAWKPHRIVADNAQSVFGDGSRFILASGEESSSDDNSATSIFPGTLLSFGSCSHCRLGSRYHVDLFGTGSEEQMRTHIECQLLHLIESSTEKQAIFQVLYPRRVDDVLRGMAEEYCLSPSPPDMDILKMTTLEAPFWKAARL